MYNTLYEGTRALNQAWTLAVEISFYVFLPIFALCMRRAGGARTVAARLRLQIYVLVAMYVASTAFAWWGTSTAWPSACRRAVLAAGEPRLVCAGNGRGGRVGGDPGGRLAAPCVVLVERWPELFWGSAIVLFYVSSPWVNAGLNPGPTSAESMYRQAVQGVARCCCFSQWRSAGRVPALCRATQRPPLVYCGVVSYGIYLWHQTFIEQATKAQLEPAFHASMALLLTYAIPMAIIAASISWFVVERPIVRWASATAASFRSIAGASISRMKSWLTQPGRRGRLVVAAVDGVLFFGYVVAVIGVPGTAGHTAGAVYGVDSARILAAAKYAWSGRHSRTGPACT